MGTLRDKLLTGEVPDPFAARFSWKLWDRCLSENSDVGDARLYSAARLIRDCVERLLARLQTTVYTKLDPATEIELLVMYMNAQIAGLAKDGLELIKKKRRGLAGYVPRFKTDADNIYSSDDLHTNLVDALRHPLQFQLSRLQRGPHPRCEVGREIHAEIHKVADLAIAWAAVKTVWQLCIYHDYTPDELENEIVFCGASDQSYFVLGRHRAQLENVSEYVRHGRMTQYDRGSRSLRAGSYARSGTDAVLVDPGTFDADLRSWVVDPFLKSEILQMNLDDSSGLLISEFLGAWETIGDIASSVLGRLGVDGTTDPEEVVLDQQARFSKKSISTILSKVNSLSFEKCAAVISILSLAAEGRFDPWSTPLIDMGDDTVLMLLGVLCWANRSFVIESILKKCHFDLERRGPRFERFVRDCLVCSMETCRFSQIVFVSPPGIVLSNDDGTSEEIDLLFSIGRDLYLVEAKACLFPVEIEDDYFLTRKLVEANEQLSRKLTFVQRNLNKIQTLNDSLKQLPTAPATVQGIVVTNFPGGPASWSTFPIIDPTALAGYFGQGASIGVIEYGQKQAKIDRQLVCPYYWDFASFRRNFSKYLDYSPHTRTFKRFLVLQRTRFPLSEHGLRDFVVFMPEVVLPENDGEIDSAIKDEYGKLEHLLQN